MITEKIPFTKEPARYTEQDFRSSYLYLNKGDESNDGAYEQQNGLFDIAIKEEWIYPKSGIVFSVKKKEELE